MDSILQKEKVCMVCRTTRNLESHHIFGGARRKISEKYGLKVWLCHEHHTGNNGVHFNKDMRLELQKEAEKAYILRHSFKEWMERYGKNYLEEKDVSD